VPRKKRKEKGAAPVREEVTPVERSTDLAALTELVTRTLSGLQSSSGGEVLASSLKRTLLRKDPTFSEADYGFRGFGEMLRNLAERGVVELSEGPAKGDPEVGFPTGGTGQEDEAFALLQTIVAELEQAGSSPALSGLKNQLRKRQSDFSEKKYGFGGFLQFCKAAQARGMIELTWDDDAEDYVLRVPLPD
jgi:hypothetical protein